MPRLFAVRNSPLCGGAAARLTAEPVTSSLLTRSPSCVNSARRSDDGFPLFRRTLCSLQVRLFPPKKPRFVPRLFAVRNSPLCGGAARLTAEPVTSSLLTLTERRRAAFPSEFSLTLRRTAPSVRLPYVPSVQPFAFPFAIPSSLRSSLRVQLFPPKKPRIHPRLFAVRNSPPCGGAAARLTAEPVTSSLLTLAERYRAAFPSGFSVGSPPCGSVGATALRPVCATVCLSVRCSVLATLVLTSPVVSTSQNLK